MEDKYKNLSIVHDMTKNEREEYKKLVEEAKQKQTQETSGEWIYRIRGIPGKMKVMKIEQKTNA